MSRVAKADCSARRMLFVTWATHARRARKIAELHRHCCGMVEVHARQVVVPRTAKGSVMQRRVRPAASRQLLAPAAGRAPRLADAGCARARSDGWPRTRARACAHVLRARVRARTRARMRRRVAGGGTDDRRLSGRAQAQEVGTRADLRDTVKVHRHRSIGF